MDNHTGIGQAKPRRPHTNLGAQLISILLRCIGDMPMHRGKVWDVAYEGALDSNGHGLSPDIMFGEVDKDDVMYPYILIEIEHTQGIADAKTKAQEYVEHYFDENCELEVYVVNYLTHEWLAFGPNADSCIPSYSSLLNMDLDDEVDWDMVDRLGKLIKI